MRKSIENTDFVLIARHTDNGRKDKIHQELIK